jgi:chaperonin cofactor prefoldin
MLAGVGCKDYDDDIDKVNDRLDQLETGKLATLEQQIAAINSSIASLETAYKAADAELKTALEKQASDLTAAKSALEASIAALKSTHEADIAKLTGDLNALGSKVEGYNTDLKAEIKKVADDLAANYYTKTVIDQKLAALDAKFAGEIAALDTKITACNEAIEAIKGQIEAMKTQIAGKVDQSVYDAFTQTTNQSLQANAQAISVLQALCAGFPEGQTIKGYIDAAKADVVAMLDNYLLKSTYETFLTAYGEFKTGIEGRADAAEAEIDTLNAWMEEMTKDGGTLALLEQRLQSAIDAKTTLAEVKATYNAECAEFLAGVNGIITAAIAEDGIIGAELKSKLDALKLDLQGQIDALEARIGALEGQVGELADRIQSLELVPSCLWDEMTENMIQLGNDYIMADNGDYIDVNTNPKKWITFQVAPAKLASSIVTGYANGSVSLDFCEEEIKYDTRAQFTNIEKVELVSAAKGQFRMLINTDYYKQQLEEEKVLAIALKIVQTSASEGMQGIEFISKYYAVVPDGENLTDQFIVAKPEGEGYQPLSALEYNTVKYSKFYNDKTPLKMMGEYVVVFEDFDGTLIPVADAAKKYDWDILPKFMKDGDEVAANVSRAAAVSTNGITASDFIFSPALAQSYNVAGNRVTKETVTVKTPNTRNIGGTVTDKGAMTMTVNNKIVTLDQYVAVITYTREMLGDYAVAPTSFDWQYTKWNTNADGDFSNVVYTTSEGRFAATGGAPALTAEQFNDIAGYLENPIEWVVEEASGLDAGIKVSAVRSSLPHDDPDSQWIQFQVSGYSYSEGVRTIKVSKTIDILAGDQIKVTAEITVNGPTAQTLDISKTLNAVSTAQIAYTKVQIGTGAYSTTDITKYFGNNSNVQAFVAEAGAKQFTTTLTANAGTADRTVEFIASVAASTPNFSATLDNMDFSKGAIGFSLNANQTIEVPFGPKIKVVGDFTVTKPAVKLQEGARLLNGVVTLEGVLDFSTGRLTYRNSTFKYNNVDLTLALYAQPADVGATVRYAVNIPQSMVAGQCPAIAADGKTLNWNSAYPADDITITTTLYDANDSKVEVRDFKVAVKKPITAVPTVAENVSIEVPANVRKEINLYDYAQLYDFENNELFSATEGGVVTNQWIGVMNWASISNTYNLNATWSIASVACEDGTSVLDYRFTDGYKFIVNDNTAQTFVKTFTVKAKIAVTGNYGYNESSVFEFKLTPVTE